MHQTSKREDHHASPLTTLKRPTAIVLLLSGIMLLACSEKHGTPSSSMTVGERDTTKGARAAIAVQPTTRPVDMLEVALEVATTKSIDQLVSLAPKDVQAILLREYDRQPPRWGQWRMALQAGLAARGSQNFLIDRYPVDESDTRKAVGSRGLGSAYVSENVHVQWPCKAPAASGKIGHDQVSSCSLHLAYYKERYYLVESDLEWTVVTAPVELFKSLRMLTKEMCACNSKECADSIAVRYTAVLDKYKDAKGTPSQQGEAILLDRRLRACRERVNAAQ